MRKKMLLMVCLLIVVGSTSGCDKQQNSFDQKMNTNKNDSVIVSEEVESVREIYLDDGDTFAAIMEDGDLYTWGSNSFGKLGVEKRREDYQPVKILENVATMEIEDDYCAALTEDGCLYMWGDNEHGQLGNGTTNASSIPIKVMDNVASMDIAGDAAGAVTADGSLYMWGYNNWGEIGNDSYDDCLTPTKVLDNIVSVTLVYQTSSAIRADAGLYMWGSGYGKTPISVADNVQSFYMAYGRDVYAAITYDNTLYMWGTISVDNLLMERQRIKRSR